MKLHLEWEKPLTLKKPTKAQIGYSFDYAKLPEKAGIYVFGRLFGNQLEALYVGKASNLRARAKNHLNNLKLMQHLRNAKNGTRILMVGRFRAGKAQREEKCLPILERALIRYFLAEGHDLVNKQGTRIKRHEITSAGAGWKLPKLMFVDRPKGE